MGLLIGAAAASAPAQHVHRGPVVHDRDADRVLATRSPHYYNRTDDTRRPGFNGRLWISENFDRNVRNPVDWGAPGPTYFCASDKQAPLAFVKVGTQVIAVSPWVGLDEESFPTHERGRQQWLRERGYTGGVRTHVNPAVLRDMLHAERPKHAPASRRERAEPAKEIEPSATIRLRRPMQEAPTRERDVRAEPETRFSWPDSAKATTVARTEKSETVAVNNPE